MKLCYWVYLQKAKQKNRRHFIVFLHLFPAFFQVSCPSCNCANYIALLLQSSGSDCVQAIPTRLVTAKSRSCLPVDSGRKLGHVCGATPRGATHDRFMRSWPRAMIFMTSLLTSRVQHSPAWEQMQLYLPLFLCVKSPKDTNGVSQSDGNA